LATSYRPLTVLLPPPPHSGSTRTRTACERPSNAGDEPGSPVPLIVDETNRGDGADDLLERGARVAGLAVGGGGRPRPPATGRLHEASAEVLKCRASH
jgi:hypothetical protein